MFILQNDRYLRLLLLWLLKAIGCLGALEQNTFKQPYQKVLCPHELTNLSIIWPTSLLIYV